MIPIAARWKGQPYSKLRKALIDQDVGYDYLAVKIGRKSCYVDRRMNGRAEWTQKDMYIILGFLHVPIDQMHEYFPPEYKAHAAKRVAHA